MNTLFSAYQHIGDVIVSTLSLKDRCSLAETCKDTRNFVYNPKWWTEVELPFKGTAKDAEMLTVIYPYSGAKPIGLYSTLRPPGDPLALENLLESLVPSKGRFANAVKVEFKNHMFNDRAMELAVELFPSLERLDLDGARLTEKGINRVKDFRKLRFLSVNCKNEIKWDAKQWLGPLESHLERLSMNIKEEQSVFLKKCKQCRFLFNPNFNSDRSCLYHPGEYSGYGHSCSSYDCCGSNTPCYLGTPGCTFGPHNAEKGYCYYQSWPPELYDVPFVETMGASGYRYIGDRRSSHIG